MLLYFAYFPNWNISDKGYCFIIFGKHYAIWLPNMKYLFFVFFSAIFHAQGIVSGNVFSEQGGVLPRIFIINLETNEQIISNNDGSFSIKAHINDELRFIKENYERHSKRISSQDFYNPLSITLIQIPIEIEEVKLGFNSTGNIKRDMNFNISRKNKLLNDEIQNYIKTHPEEKKDPKIGSSTFGAPDMYQGQVNILSVGAGASGGVLGLVAKALLKKDKHKPNFSEIQEFHRKVKESFYGSYFIKKGINEFEFESYIIYLDNNYKFSERYFNNFDTFEIEKKLKSLLEDYIKKR